LLLYLPLLHLNGQFSVVTHQILGPQFPQESFGN